MDIKDVIEELEVYIDLEQSELSELCYSLIDCMKYPDYMSKDFELALETEIRQQLELYKEYCEIKTETEVIPERIIETTYINYK